MVASIAQISTTKVTVLMPPAVPTGDPPINIISKVRMEEAFDKCSVGTMPKPAERMVAEACGLDGSIVAYISLHPEHKEFWNRIANRLALVTNIEDDDI